MCIRDSFWAIPGTLVSIFNATETMKQVAVPALRIISLSFCTAGACIALGSSFQALGKSVYSMITSIIRQLVFLVPIAYVLARYGPVSYTQLDVYKRQGLDDVQAQAILDMRLKALQGLDREKLQAEYKELEEKIAYFLKVLSDDALVRSILKEELSAIAEKYGDDRKTEIQDVEDEIDIEDLIEEEECVFTLTENGYIKRTAVSEYTAQKMCIRDR